MEGEGQGNPGILEETKEIQGIEREARIREAGYNIQRNSNDKASEVERVSCYFRKSSWSPPLYAKVRPPWEFY